MASAQTHLAWATENEAFYREILASKRPRLDWAVTVLFYAIVHEVSAFLRTEINSVPKGHKPTKQALLADPGWAQILGLYEGAQADANQTRYRCYMPGKLEVHMAEARLHAIRLEIAAVQSGGVNHPTNGGS